MKTVVLGLGNLLMGDDGFGVHAAQALIRSGVPEGVQVLEVGTAVLDALPAIEKAERIVVLDAVKGGREPGTVWRLPLAAFGSPESLASLHGLGILGVLALSRPGGPVDGIVIGVEPGRIGWSTDLSPDVAAALPRVVEQVMRDLKD